MSIDREELSAWLRLLHAPSIGRQTARKLLAAFGSPQALLEASPGKLSDMMGRPVATSLATSLANSSAIAAPLVDATLAWLSSAPDSTRHVITLGDSLYPELLIETADPPLLIYAEGRIETLRSDAIAIVGSRNPTSQGMENARAFAAHLSNVGLTVVSGLALGIDVAAHEGALDGSGGTIAVVGTGLDTVYPRRHQDLARRIAARGLLISEYAIGTPPLPAHFPQRNRIIAGLSRGTLVVEAAIRSGSLITARMALEGGREVFAIPGSIHSPQSRGCNHLIKTGAKLVDRAEDILEELQAGTSGTSARRPPIAPVHRAKPGGSPPEESPEVSAPSHQELIEGEQLHREEAGSEPLANEPVDPVLDALGYDPMTLDELVARTGRTPHDLSIRLLDLELQGRVSRMPGQVFQRLVVV